MNIAHAIFYIYKITKVVHYCRIQHKKFQTITYCNVLLCLSVRLYIFCVRPSVHFLCPSVCTLLFVLFCFVFCFLFFVFCFLPTIFNRWQQQLSAIVLKQHMLAWSPTGTNQTYAPDAKINNGHQRHRLAATYDHHIAIAMTKISW